MAEIEAKIESKDSNLLEKLRWIAKDIQEHGDSFVFLERNKEGEVTDFHNLEVQSIHKLIKEDGSTPIYPEPAYQQIWKGYPTINLTTMEVLEITAPIPKGRFYPFSQREVNRQ